MTQLRKVIAAEIQASRIKHGLQQKDLAALVDVTRTSISNIENGRQAVSLVLFCKVADALSENPGEFLNKILDIKTEPSISKEDVRDINIRKIISKTIEEKE